MDHFDVSIIGGGPGRAPAATTAVDWAMAPSRRHRIMNTSARIGGEAALALFAPPKGDLENTVHSNPILSGVPGLATLSVAGKAMAVFAE